MELFTPQYYTHFRCIASACPDSCCKEWEVDVDDGVRVLSLEHAVVAELDGCKSIRKVVSIDGTDISETVRLKFKKNSGAED